MRRSSQRAPAGRRTGLVGLARPAAGSHSMQMVLLEAAFVFALLGLITYVITRLLMLPAERRTAARTGHWKAVHHDSDGVTRVAVEKVSVGGAGVLDEHLISTIPIDDPDYDANFLTAMVPSREHQALFEA